MNRDIAATLALAALAQLAAFGKSVLVAYYFGLGTDVDGYYLAQVIPMTLAGIVTGFLQTGFLTVYTGHLASDRTEAAAALLGRTLQVVAAAGFVLSLIIAAAAPWLLQVLAPGAAPAARDAAIFSLRALAFLLVLNVLADCVGLALNAHRSFALAALAPTANALVASGLLAVAPDWGLANLVLGTLMGVLAQLVIVAYGLRLKGIGLRGPRKADLGAVLRSGAPIVPGLVFANITAAVPTVVAVSLGEGAVAAFSVALRLHGAATQALTIALSTVLLPHFAIAAAQADLRFIRNWLTTAFPVLATISVAVLLWVGLQGEAFVALAYERGAFDAAATSTVAYAWFYLTVGLFPFAWGVSLAKVLQAFRFGGVLSVVALLTLFLTVALCVALSSKAGLVGLALAPGGAALATTVAFQLIVFGKIAAGQKAGRSFGWRQSVSLLTSSGLLATLAFMLSFLTRNQSALIQLSAVGVVLSCAIAAMFSIAHHTRNRKGVNA